MDDKMIYILPVKDKPIKFVFNELPCPKLINIGLTYRCEYSKSKLEDMNYVMFCSADKCEHDIKIQISTED
jgi:hypothetical protein